MTRGEQRLSIAGPSGALELALNMPEQAPRGIALVAHPHPLQGGTMDNKVVQTLAKTFAGLGYASVRFNFRGVAGSAAYSTTAPARRRAGRAGPRPHRVWRPSRSTRRVLVRDIRPDTRRAASDR
jgi:predicted alpha/beta-hydrolase family hydrolase